MLGVVNNAVMNMGVQIPFRLIGFISFECIPRNGIADTYGGFIFSFLKILHMFIKKSFLCGDWVLCG